MTQEQEATLLRETHENNVMLRSIVKYINEQLITKDQKDFSLNLFANVLGNKNRLNMKYYTQEHKLTLVDWGFDPDKPVTDMTLGELYSLMKFAINRKDCSS